MPAVLEFPSANARDVVGQVVRTLIHPFTSLIDHLWPSHLYSPFVNFASVCTFNLICQSSSLDELPARAYLSQSKVKIYLNDALSTLLKIASYQSTSAKVPPAESVDLRPLRFLTNYFNQVISDSCNHTIGRNFAFICSTKYNRVKFLGGLFRSTKGKMLEL